MTLRLHTAAHQAITHKRLITLHQKRGNDSVKWPLTRCVDVGVAVLQ